MGIGELGELGVNAPRTVIRGANIGRGYVCINLTPDLSERSPVLGTQCCIATATKTYPAMVSVCFDLALLLVS